MAYKAEPENFDRDTSARFPRKNKVRTGVIMSHKQQGKNNPKHKSSQGYLMLCKKDVITEHNYKLHSSKNSLGKSSGKESVKEGLLGSLDNRSVAVKKYHDSENKWKSELKALKK